MYVAVRSRNRDSSVNHVALADVKLSQNCPISGEISDSDSMESSDFGCRFQCLALRWGDATRFHIGKSRNDTKLACTIDGFISSLSLWFLTRLSNRIHYSSC